MRPEWDDAVQQELDRRVLARSKADAKENDPDPKSKGRKSKQGSDTALPEGADGGKTSMEKDPAKWQLSHMSLAESRIMSWSSIFIVLLS